MLKVFYLTTTLNKSVPPALLLTWWSQFCKKLSNERRSVSNCFFTSHTLGGWLAQVTAFTTEYLEVKGSKFLKILRREENEPPTSSTTQDIHDVRQRYQPHTVVFDSPGCKVMLSQMADRLDVCHKGCSTDLQHLDITSYLSAPNRIYTCNTHLGTLYRIFTGVTYSHHTIYLV